ncbi:hypothetical protein [Halomontanus rarus]|nr:hypothetical protein [Halovivax sp. TS33]
MTREAFANEKAREDDRLESDESGPEPNESASVPLSVTVLDVFQSGERRN